jgi:glyoxylase-like metal-dependent hydrolase (beta-lactamase superfamily II)
MTWKSATAIVPEATIGIESRPTVDTESYRFKLGDFGYIAISDGSVNYPLGHLFSNTPRMRIEEALRQRDLPIDYVTTPLTCLYVNAGENQVLVDTGAGGLTPGTGRLRQNLRAAGVEPKAIGAVIITHAHPAHVGGTVDGEGQLVYTNARYYIWKAEWDFWTSETAFAKASERHISIARRHLESIQDRLTLLDQEGEIMPGIDAIPAPGHTPGHIVVSISSADERLLYVSDTVYHPLHLEHPDWTPIYDVAPEKAKISKHRIFDVAAEEKTWVIGQHFPPFPSLGHVTAQEKGWQWQPTEKAR